MEIIQYMPGIGSEYLVAKEDFESKKREFEEKTVNKINDNISSDA